MKIDSDQEFVDELKAIVYSICKEQSSPSGSSQGFQVLKYCYYYYYYYLIILVTDVVVIVVQK